MAMNWIKGLVAPPAFGQPVPGQQAWQQSPQGPQAQQPSYGGGPPVGGAPSPYGVQPIANDPQGALPPPPAQVPGPPAYDPSAMQWSVGTKSQGAGGPIAAPITAGTVGGTTTASLEARCAQLQHDVESLALFARTLLTMLEENKMVTREQFDATKNRLDMLDGKLDDR